MTPRTEGRTRRIIEYPSVPADGDLVEWLAAQARAHGLRWLLAHTRGGPSWGELRADGLHLSSDAAAFPRAGLELSSDTLRRCRLFGPAGELLVWRGPDVGAGSPSRAEGLRARLLRDDDTGDDIMYLSEPYLLSGWGDTARDGFVELVEGEQGTVHTPPLPAAVPEGSRAAILVRHYLATDDETGQVSIETSRMVELISLVPR
jgi:CRISPR-associated protein (TIGR03984 family)